MSIDKAIEVILRLKDQSFKTGMRDAESQLKSFGENMNNIGQKAAIGFAGLGAVVLASANSFREFEAGMSNISTIVDTSKESMSQMGQQVLDMSKRMPVGINDLVAGLYDLRSANVDATVAMDALEASAKLGVAGLGSTAESVDLMTTAMNAFSDEGLSANTIADILFKTTQYGKNTIAELAQAFGNTAPLVKGAGVSLADFSAATAALTAVGVPAAEAQNSIRAAVVALKKPTEEMQAVFKSLGVQSGPELIKVSGNLGNAFKAVQNEAARLGIPLEKVTGRVEGAAAMTSIATSANGIYTKSLADMTSGINSLDQAYAKQAATFDSAIKLMLNNVQVLAIQIGAALAPALTVAANAVKTVADWFSRMPEPVKQFIAVGLLAGTVLTGIVAGATLLIGSIAGSIAAIIGLTTTIGLWIAENAVMIQGAMVIASFLGGVLTPIIVGVGAAVAAMAIAWNTNFLNIQTITKQSVAFIGGVLGDMFNGIGKMLNTAVQWVASILNQIGAAISPFVSLISKAFSSYFAWLGNLLGSFARGVLGVIGGVANGILSLLVQMAKNAASIVNPFLEKLNLPTVNVDGMVNSVKIGTDIALKYFKDKWAEAGKVAIKVPAVATAKIPSRPGNKPGASEGGTPYVAPSDAEKKKGADAAQKKQAEAVRAVVDTLSNSLKANSLALDEVIVKMGAYASEGDKLSAQLIKLDKDEQTLQASRSKLSGMHLSGDAEKARVKALQDVNEQLRQNAIDETQIQNDLVKIRNEAALTDKLAANETVYEALIAKMSQYATESMKLSTTLMRLKSDEKALNDARQKMIDAGANSKGLDEINQKIRKNANEQIKIEGEISRAQEKERQARLDAEAKFEQTKASLKNDYLKRQEDHELRGLQDMLNRKLISQRAFNEEAARIRDAQGEREKALIDMQIQGLQQQLAIKSQGNIITAETVALNEQIYALTQQKTAIDQENLIKQQEAMAALQASNPLSLASFTESVSQALDQFNSNFVQGILNGNLNIAESFKSLGISILTDMEKKVFEKLKDTILTTFTTILTGNTKTLGEMTKGFTSFAQGVGHVFTSMGSAIGGVFQSIASFALASIKTIFNAQKAAAVKEALITAHSSAMKAFHAVVGIPVIGPVLAPAAYAAALGFQLAKAAIIGGVSLGFADGTPNLPSDMVANVHKGEMIIPATFAEGIRSGNLTLGGPGQRGQQEGRSVTIQVSFDGANFYGDEETMAARIERLLVEKLNVVGGRLALGEL